MEITREHLEEKYKACVDALDENKNCETCKYHLSKICDDCFNLLLGFPVNPTNWEAK